MFSVLPPMAPGTPPVKHLAGLYDSECGCLIRNSICGCSLHTLFWSQQRHCEYVKLLICAMCRIPGHLRILRDDAEREWFAADHVQRDIKNSRKGVHHCTAVLAQQLFATSRSLLHAQLVLH